MKEKDEDIEKTDNQDEETSNLNIEELTEVQGGVDDNDDAEPDCGLGCYIGSGSVQIEGTDQDNQG
jgi:hypothetical protein